MTEKKPVILVNYAIGSSYESFIEVNYRLPPPLFEKVLEHEQAHENGSYNAQDIKNDFMKKKKGYFFESLKFALFNPAAFIGFFPWMYSYYAQAFTWNSSALIPFVYLGAIFCLLYHFIMGVGLLNLAIFYILVVLGLNGILLGLTHYIVKKDKSFIFEEMKD